MSFSVAYEALEEMVMFNCEYKQLNMLYKICIKIGMPSAKKALPKMFSLEHVKDMFIFTFSSI